MPEVEKAHPEVFNVLLQLLDEGRLTDGQGRTVDFRNTVVIMTSNIGSPLIQEYAGGNQEEMRQRVMDMLRSTLRPEFLNRLDEIILFHALAREHIREIVALQIDMLRERLTERLKIDLELTSAATEFLTEAGFDPVYGARPLKRVIQRSIENPLAMALLERGFAEGDTILADATDGKITFEKRVRTAA